jgi:hypothetical protein
VLERIIRAKLKEYEDLMLILESVGKIYDIGMMKLLVNNQLVQKLNSVKKYFNSVSIILRDDLSCVLLLCFHIFGDKAGSKGTATKHSKFHVFFLNDLAGHSLHFLDDYFPLLRVEG